MNYDKFAPLLGNEWGPLLKPFIESEACDKIYERLKYDTQRGKVICPDSKNVWRTFYETPVKDLKVVMLLQDPYAKKFGKVYQADGIAMSCSNLKEPQPSLDMFYDGIEDDLKLISGRWLDLTWLCNQGVMMLNTSLTCEANKSGSHAELWKPFMVYFLDEVITTLPPGIIFVLCGNISQGFERWISPLHHRIVKVEHPANAYRKARGWKHDHVFSLINKILTLEKKTPVDWNLGPVPF